jgi:hypothetical protein
MKNMLYVCVAIKRNHNFNKITLNMGLDISIVTNNYEELIRNEKDDSIYKYSLSRTFCHFICRRNVVSHEPELDQIGKLTGVDISPIYEMESYPDEESLECFLEMEDSEEGKQKILKEAEEDKVKLEGNIDRVLMSITGLIDKLNFIDNLPALLLPTDYDLLNHTEYFTDFKLDKGDGYIGNNFGRDLRNFKCFLEFAKERGTTTVWFEYG